MSGKGAAIFFIAFSAREAEEAAAKRGLKLGEKEKDKPVAVHVTDVAMFQGYNWSQSSLVCVGHFEKVRFFMGNTWLAVTRKIPPHRVEYD